MNRRLAALAMAGVFALSLTGCSSNSAGEGEQEIVLPEPTEQSGGSIFGESILSVPENVTLYYVSGDGTSFSAVSRSLTGSSTSDLCEQVARCWTILRRSAHPPCPMEPLCWAWRPRRAWQRSTSRWRPIALRTSRRF